MGFILIFVLVIACIGKISSFFFSFFIKKKKGFLKPHRKFKFSFSAVQCLGRKKMAATNASIIASPKQLISATRISCVGKPNASLTTKRGNKFFDASSRSSSRKKKHIKVIREITSASATFTTIPKEEIEEFVLPSWAAFELGKAPVYWKTMNGLPPTAGEKLKLFYNPTANKLVPNEDYGFAFNGGFNQPIMCGGEPRAMLRKDRGEDDDPMYTIQIGVPKHALNLIFSFTNGVDWDGPYRLPFQVPKAWRNRPIEFFDEGLAEELSVEGACDRAIFPDTNTIVASCAMIGNLTVEGGDRCNLDIVSGCMDSDSILYNPLASVDDGSCPVDPDFNE